MKDILIRQIPILASLPVEEMTRLEASLAVRKFPGSTLLFREGEKGDVFYIILAGQVQVIKSLGTDAPSTLPKTGETESALPWAVAAALSGVGLIGAGFVLRRRRALM